jgi:hypothetical protein
VISALSCVLDFCCDLSSDPLNAIPAHLFVNFLTTQFIPHHCHLRLWYTLSYNTHTMSDEANTVTLLLTLAALKTQMETFFLLAK